MDPEKYNPISWYALGRIVATGLIVLFAWKASDALVLILIALVFAVALFPIVHRFNKKLPLLASILLVFLLLLLPFLGLGAFVTYNMVNQFPAILSTINGIAHNSPFIARIFGNVDIMSYLQNSTGTILNSTKSIFFTLISIFTVIFLTFYFIYDNKRLIRLFLDLFPQEHQENMEKLLSQISTVTGKYIRGNAIISVITGIVIYVGLLLLQIPFALPLAIFTAIIDLLPMVGPILGSLPAMILGFSISPTKGIFVMLLYFLYQQSENVLISPVVYNRALNISASITFIAVVIGSSVFGILGAFLALPVAASIPVIMDFKNEYIKKSELEAKK